MIAWPKKLKRKSKPISLTRLSSDTSKLFKSDDDSPTKLQPPMTPKQTFETKSETLKAPTYTAKIVPPQVLPPPKQFEKVKSSGSVFGFFWNVVAKVQDAHSSLDKYLAHWFGLNHSKYQWALDDYYENQGMRTPTASPTLQQQFHTPRHQFTALSNISSSISRHSSPSQQQHQLCNHKQADSSTFSAPSSSTRPAVKHAETTASASSLLSTTASFHDSTNISFVPAIPPVFSKDPVHLQPSRYSCFGSSSSAIHLGGFFSILGVSEGVERWVSIYLGLFDLQRVAHGLLEE